MNDILEMQNQQSSGNILEDVENLSPEDQATAIQAAGNPSLGQEMLAKIKTNQQLSKGDWVGLLAATIIPVLAGAAIGGKKGALAGLKAGGEGGLAGLNVHQQQVRDQNAIDLAAAKVQLGKEASADAAQAQLAKEARARDESDRQAVRNANIDIGKALKKQELGVGGGQNINIKNNLSAATTKDLADGTSSIQTVQAVKKRLLSVADKYGGIEAMREASQAGQVGNVLTRKFKEFLPQSEERSLNADLQFLTASLGSQVMKGALSDNDLRRIEEFVTGGKLADLPLILDRLDTAEQNATRNRNNFAEALFQNGDISEQLKNFYTGQSGDQTGNIGSFSNWKNKLTGAE